MSHLSKVEILQSSCAFPEHTYSSEELCTALLENYYRNQLSYEEEQFVRHIFLKSQIKACHVALESDKLFKRMSLSEYHSHVTSVILDLGTRSANDCLAKLEAIQPSFRSTVTHLVFGTMTAMTGAPSMDVRLSITLGLSPLVKRLNVDSMGCLSGFRLLGLCQDLVLQKPSKNRVLLIVCDIRSALGNQLPKYNPLVFNRSDVIVSALFRDGGGAAILGCLDQYPITPCLVSCSYFPKSPRLIIEDHQSFLIPNSIDLAWLKQHDDGAQQLFLSKSLPVCISAHLFEIIKPLVDLHKIELHNSVFAVHTGGPRVIEGIRSALQLDPKQLGASWWVMMNKGNLSGASNIIVLHYWIEYLQRSLSFLQEETHKSLFPEEVHNYKHLVGISFGPGVGVEIVICSIKHTI
jgi:alkylresorcinol/alkylpyrone synthase